LHLHDETTPEVQLSEMGAQGSLHGEVIKKALDLRSWQAASDLVRGWEASGDIGVVRLEIPFLKDAIEASRLFRTIS
jgi:hypothetical protein